MYNVIKSVVASGGFKLADIQHKIKKLYALGDLTEAQMDELLQAAAGGASANAERPETIALLVAMSSRLDSIEERLDALEGVSAETPDEGESDDIQYPEWKAWDGISTDYQPDTIVSHNGKLWQSTFAGQNVWEPGAVGIDDRFWVEYV